MQCISPVDERIPKKELQPKKARQILPGSFVMRA